MSNSGLAADIPLGPFEGTLITGYTASKTARLHATQDCSRLKAENVSEVKVPLNAESIRQMCADCARHGRWAPPRTALGMYLQALSSYRLPYQLESYAGPDPDDAVTDTEVAAAAALLRHGDHPSAEDIDDDDDESNDSPWAKFRAARELRDSQIIPEWCAAVESLMDAAVTVARYPWLKPWAGKKLDLKSKYAELLRLRAAQFVNSDALIVACSVDQMPRPEFPVEDSAFAVLGDAVDIHSVLRRLWSEWNIRVSHGWLMPQEYDYLGYQIVDRLGNKRKGRDQLSTRSRDLLNAWSEAALSMAPQATNEPDLLIVASLHAPEVDRHGRRESLDEQLTRWELGVLATYQVAADWGTRTFLLKVPPPIATRLVTDWGTLQCVQVAGVPEDVAIYQPLLAASSDERLAAAGHSAFLPGLLDDTPVSQRRVVSLAEVRALREELDERGQFFLVCSVDNGVEALPLAAVEARCKGGWEGILIAEAGDLPAAIIDPHLTGLRDTTDGEVDEVSAPDWDDRNLPVEHPEFGDHLGNAAGERKLRWVNSRREERRRLERNFRVLALARGVHDLRALDREGDGSINVPRDVWYALLLMREHLDLRPFMPRIPEDHWNSGLDLPLAVLAEIQIYTTNADPRIAGKGHSPFCQHARGRGISRSDFLLTLEEMLRRTDLDWCSNCGGYVIRRLSDKQISYYRVAHRLHDIDRALTRALDGNLSQEVNLESAQSAFGEISEWLYGSHNPCQAGDTWRVQDVLRELKGKAELLAQYRRDGWPDSGSVVQFKPRR